MKKFLISLAILFLLLAVVSPQSTQSRISKELGIRVTGGRELLHYDTHSGNGDGTACIALRFEDDKVLKEIQASRWKSFPLDETVRTFVYGVSDGTNAAGPFLTDDNGKALVPEILHGYYVLIDRQAQTDLATGADILHRHSMNVTLGLYDTDTDTLYFCELDT